MRKFRKREIVSGYLFGVLSVYYVQLLIGDLVGATEIMSKILIFNVPLYIPFFLSNASLVSYEICKNILKEEEKKKDQE